MATRLNTKPDTAIYLYGITRQAVPSPKVIGVDGSARVESLPCAEFVCWISRVSHADFAENLANNMENLDWLAAAGVRHQRAVAAIAEQTQVLPARFGTVFLSETSLQTDVEKRKRTLDADFRRIDGADEWGVKVFSLPAKVELPPAESRTGKDYLRAKAAMLQRRPSKKVKGPDPELQAFGEELTKLAVAAADGGKVSSGQRGLEWQSSFLLKRADRNKFESLLKRYSKRWTDSRRIEVTGPWPPYSFVSKDSASS
jgi:hypothetical protein